MKKLMLLFVRLLISISFLLPIGGVDIKTGEANVLNEGTNSISGQVTDGAGNPAADVEITAYPQQGAVLVIDEGGTPVSGAEVFRNGSLAGVTDSNGMLVIPTLSAYQYLTARLFITEVASGKDNHNFNSTQDWAYRVYITSLDSDTFQLYQVSDPSTLQILVLKKENPLIGFNVRATVEWDADSTYLSYLENGFYWANQYLYDASDGQMIFENVSITDNNLFMSAADFQFRASNTRWPRASLNGMYKGSTKNVALGRYFDGSSSTQGDWNKYNGYSTLVHELGHYSLSLYDSYLYLDEEGNKQDAYCTSKSIRINGNDDINATLMDSQYNASEFAMRGVDGMWSEECEITWHYMETGESDWETIVEKFKDTNNPPRWLLKTPKTRGGVFSGPDFVKVSGWYNIFIQTDEDSGVCEAPVSLILELWGAPAEDIMIVLRKADRDIVQGKTDENGEITILGASEGDLITFYTSGIGITLNSNPISCDNDLILNQAAAVKTDANNISLEPAAFDMIVTTIPGATPNQIQVIVQAPADLPLPPAARVTQNGALAVDVPLAYDAGLSAYSGIVDLDPNLLTSGVVVVSATDIDSNVVSTFTSFHIETVDPGLDSEVYSEDGMAELYLPDGVLSEAGHVSISNAQSSSVIPEGKVLLTPPYQVHLSDGLNLIGNANLTLYYLDFGGSLLNTDLSSAQIYREDSGNWLPLDSNVSQNTQMVSSLISSDGVYAVFADWEAKIFLPMINNNSLTSTSEVKVSDKVQQSVGETFPIESQQLDLISEVIPSIFTTTDENGNYSLINLDDGTYILIASQEGATFFPPSRNVSLPPDVSEQNFVKNSPDFETTIFIPAGEFQMGCDPDHNGGYSCADDELPLRTIYLDDYIIDKYEVTNGQYIQCVADGGCTPPLRNASNTRYGEEIYYGNPAYDNYPVLLVDWFQASDYCTWAGKRLPSEAEWEKAARGTTVRAYPWGDSAPTTELVNGMNSVIEGDTTEVGSYPQGISPFGIYDMAGNVQEWVNDWYAVDYYEIMPASNPTGPSEGTNKVLRGGAYLHQAEGLRTSERESINPLSEFFHIGFRCVSDF